MRYVTCKPYHTHTCAEFFCGIPTLSLSCHWLWESSFWHNLADLPTTGPLNFLMCHQFLPLVVLIVCAADPKHIIILWIYQIFSQFSHSRKTCLNDLKDDQDDCITVKLYIAYLHPQRPNAASAGLPWGSWVEDWDGQAIQLLLVPPLLLLQTWFLGEHEAERARYQLEWERELFRQVPWVCERRYVLASCQLAICHQKPLGSHTSMFTSLCLYYTYSTIFSMFVRVTKYTSIYYIYYMTI